ncbi:hypothetical protein PF008_g8401 [Phytophthora fragariae]|uniref:Uncharacterized protein n=1 Tax=Phytophthora fragariae TaxID=53985 RepID=A0A6G0RZN3_9STRA|nr:hypothetical protein PF008_g8401 [Phytophthora fragariae]
MFEFLASITLSPRDTRPVYERVEGEQAQLVHALEISVQDAPGVRVPTWNPGTSNALVWNARNGCLLG